MIILRDLQEWRGWYDKEAGLLAGYKATQPVSFPCYAYKHANVTLVYLYAATLHGMIFELQKTKKEKTEDETE